MGARSADGWNSPVHAAKLDVLLFGVLIGALQRPFYLPESNTWHLATRERM